MKELLSCRKHVLQKNQIAAGFKLKFLEQLIVVESGTTQLFSSQGFSKPPVAFLHAF